MHPALPHRFGGSASVIPVRGKSFRPDGADGAILEQLIGQVVVFWLPIVTGGLEGEEGFVIGRCSRITLEHNSDRASTRPMGEPDTKPGLRSLIPATCWVAGERFRDPVMGLTQLGRRLRHGPSMHPHRRRDGCHIHLAARPQANQFAKESAVLTLCR